MNKAEPPKQPTMVTKSSSSLIKRKPLANITNIIRNPNHHTSLKKLASSSIQTASDSSIGSTQNPINLHRPVVVLPDKSAPSKPHSLKPDKLADNKSQAAQARRQGLQDTRSKTKAAVSVHQASLQGRRDNVKEGSVSLFSTTLDKIKEKEKVDRLCLDKTVNDGKKTSVASRHSSAEKIADKRKLTDVPLSDHDKRKLTDVPLSDHRMKNANSKGKENVGQSVDSLAGNATTPESLKRKDKGKAIAVLPDYPSRKKLRNNMMDFSFPLKGVIIKEREGTGMGSDSNSVNLAQKDTGKGVFTPINYHTLEKKDNQSSCPPISRTMCASWNDSDGARDVLQSKLQTEPPPNKKKKRCSIKEEYTLPKDYVEQQRAYFKEIDDFELLVEEV